MTDLQKLGKVKRSSVVPQVNFLSIMEEGENIDELDELDAKISDLLAKGEKVVLLGRHFNAQNETPRQKTLMWEFYVWLLSINIQQPFQKFASEAALQTPPIIT